MEVPNEKRLTRFSSLLFETASTSQTQLFESKDGGSDISSISTNESDARTGKHEKDEKNQASEIDMSKFSSLSLSMASSIGKSHASEDNDDRVNIIRDSKSHVEQHELHDPPQMRKKNQGLDNVETHIDTIRGWIANVHQTSLKLSTHKTNKSRFLERFNRCKRHIPKDVGVTYELENSLECLTSCLKDTFFDHRTNLSLLVEQFSRIPDLIMTIMLIDDDEDRNRILDYPIVKWAMMSTYSFNRNRSDDTGIEHSDERFWLTDLIESGITPFTKKAIEYLELISSIAARDLLPREYRISEKNLSSFESRIVFEHKKKFHESREDLFMALINVPHFIPMLLCLSDDELEDVADTGVIKYAVEWNLYNPVGVSGVFLDLVSHIVILFSMRYTAHYWVELAYGENKSFFSLGSMLLFSFVSLGVLYWIFRRSCSLISLYSVSPKTCLKYLFTFWDLFDNLTLGLLCFVYTYLIMNLYVDIEQKYPDLYSHLDKYWYGYLSILVGMLWFSLLGLLKVLNKEFATLILAISKITRDMFMFLIVVIITILATGDMLHIYLSTNFQVCPENDPSTSNSTQAENTSAFCEKDRKSSYIAIYNMYIGDVSFSDFSGTMLTTIVYVGLTFFGIIILMNVIIALVCDSYEKSSERSERLFGRARLSYVATVIAFEELIKPKKWRELHGRHLVIHIFVQAFSFVISLISLSIILSVFWMIKSTIYSWYGWIVAALVLLPSLMIWLTFCSYLITGWDKTNGKRTVLKRLQNSYLFRKLIFRSVMYISRLVLGTQGFNTTNELTNVKMLEALAPVTTLNDSQNERDLKETSAMEDSINEKLSTIQKNNEMNQNEIKDIKNDMMDVKNELKMITQMLGKMMGD